MISYSNCKIFTNDVFFGGGGKGVVCGPEGTRFADNCVLKKNSGNAIYSYQVPYMHVHVMAPGQRL